jgi:hypothetical protein
MEIEPGSIVSLMPSELMNVTPENVLQARAVILAEAESFMDHLRNGLLMPGIPLVGLCGGDPISRDAQELFTEKIREGAVAPVQLYIRRLQDVADNLAETARAYGFSEQRIADSFAPGVEPASRA